MAVAYPDIAQVEGSDTTLLSGIERLQRPNGSVILRDQYSQDWAEIVVKHWVDAIDLATLEAFYEANKRAIVAIANADDGKTYTVKYAGRPTWQRTKGDRYSYVARFVEVAA